MCNPPLYLSGSNRFFVNIIKFLPVFTNAVVEADDNNVVVSGSCKNINPVHNRRGEEVCGKLNVDLVACAHGGNLYVNITLKLLCANPEIGSRDDVVGDYCCPGKVEI